MNNEVMCSMCHKKYITAKNSIESCCPCCGKSNMLPDKVKKPESNESNMKYISGFNLGKGIGFQMGKLTAYVEIHLMKSMVVMFMVGLTLGYCVGKFIR